MPEYRGKQKSKEVMITDQGKYHYLRLTDNNFGQFLSIIAELKMQIVDDNVGQKIFRINEDTDYLDPYELYATKLNIYTEQARDLLLANYNSSLPIEEVSGIYTDPITLEEVSVFGIIRPRDNFVNKSHLERYTSSLNEITSKLDIIESTADTPYHYSGFYIDEDQPINGYMIGITI
jgi:hypothetical protein